MLGQAGYRNTIKWFRIIANCEGVSFLVLLLIAMPMKYLADRPQGVLIIGWIHGLLFISYMIACLHVKIKYKWGYKKTFVAVIASVIPFGPFILDNLILRKETLESN